MGRGIDITLGLKDNLTGALKSAVSSSVGALDKLQSKMDNLKPPKMGGSSGGNSGGSSGGDSGSGSSVFSQMLGANLVGNALSTVASGILSAGQSLVGAIGDQFKASEEANRGALGATSANAALLGITFKESAGLTKSISATLAESANKLPGATKDYLDAFNGVSDTLVLSGGLTRKGMTEAGKEMVELTALLGQASGAGSATTSTVLGKMLGDTGSEALFRIDAFEKVPAFKALLEKDLEKAGKTLKDFFKMDAKAKQEQLVGVKKQLFSKDYIDQMNLSMGAQLDTLKSKLTDPTAGLFGFMRNVKFEGADTNVLNELGKTFSVLVSAAQEVLGSMGGVSFDPMLALVKGLRGLTAFIKNPADALPGIIDGFISGLGSVGTFLLTLPGKLIQALGSGLMNLAMDGSQVQVITAQITSGILGWVTNTFNTLASGQGGDLEGVFGVILGGFALIGNVALGILYGIGNSLPGILEAVGSGLLMTANTFGQLFVSMMTTLGSYVIELGGSVIPHVGNFFGSAISAISSWVSSIQSGFGSVVESISSGISGLITNIPSGLASIGTAIMGIGSAISSAISSLVSSAISSISGAIGSVVTGKSVGAKYSGQNLHLAQMNSFRGGIGSLNKVRTASDGLWEAAKLESSKMPSGSSLVVANSSELIVPRNQINQVLNGTGTVVNITINSKAEQVINDTVAALSEALRKPSLSMV